MPIHSVLADILAVIFMITLIVASVTYYGARKKLTQLTELYQVILGIVVSNRELKQELLEEVADNRLNTVKALTDRIRALERRESQISGTRNGDKPKLLNYNNKENPAGTQIPPGFDFCLIEGEAPPSFRICRVLF